MTITGRTLLEYYLTLSIEKHPMNFTSVQRMNCQNSWGFSMYYTQRQVVDSYAEKQIKKSQFFEVKLTTKHEDELALMLFLLQKKIKDVSMASFIYDCITCTLIDLHNDDTKRLKINADMLLKYLADWHLDSVYIKRLEFLFKRYLQEEHNSYNHHRSIK
jgi:hypothetical protein